MPGGPSALATPQAPQGAALDLHEGISHPGTRHPDPAALGCPRWPEHFRLLSSHGELVRGRCRSTNLCAYCARLAAVENAELLALDALAGEAPSVWAVLTTRSAEPDPAKFYKSREVVIRALRRRWPRCEYAALVEFTTGYGPRSGGARRPHWNLLLKGVPPEAVEQAREVIADVWCAREDAEPWAQFVGTVSEVGGLMRYVALHFQKESQAPPPGWRGHRFLKSRGYLATSTPEAREAARRSLRHKRELWRAIRRGLEGQAAEDAAAAAIALADATTWRLMSVEPSQMRRADRDAARAAAVNSERGGRGAGALDDGVQPVSAGVGVPGGVADGRRGGLPPGRLAPRAAGPGRRVARSVPGVPGARAGGEPDPVGAPELAAAVARPPGSPPCARRAPNGESRPS